MRAPTGSQHNSEQEDGRGREGDDDRSNDGCFKFAGQVLGGRQLRLPASFQRASSLPRRLGRSVTPTPAAREPEIHASARSELRSESSDVGENSSKKRAASTSPSRNEFRRSFKERIPRQLRSLIPARMMPGYNLPPRPSRKAGPIGRTWVKVYDDITYMDDTSQEYYPIVGYTGAPVKVPEANPLPRPPTPPPPPRQRVPRRVSPTPSQLSEYDNVPCNSEMAATESIQSQKETDQILILQEISNKKMRRMSQEPSLEERQLEADRELILKEITLKQINGEKEQEYPNYENEVLLQERPTVRKRENTRFKGRRQKRSGTPVATDRVINGIKDENVMDTENQTFETIEYANGENRNIPTVDDEYVVPERKSSLPSRPKRGTKIYEGVGPLEIQKHENLESAIVSVDSELTKTADINDLKEPARPTRGVKVYETVLVKKVENATELVQNTSNEPDIDLVIKTQSNADETQELTQRTQHVSLPEMKSEVDHVSPDSTTPTAAKPEKPKRGIKVYEDIVSSNKPAVQVSETEILNTMLVEEECSAVLKLTNESLPIEKESTEVQVSQDTTVQIAPQQEGASQPEDAKCINEVVQDSKEVISISTETPIKPKRGVKLYEDVVPVPANLHKSPVEEVMKPSKPKRGVKLYEDVIVADRKNESQTEIKATGGTTEAEVPPKPERGKKVYSGINFSGNEQTLETEDSEGTKSREAMPPYATVQKSKDSAMKDVTASDDNAPPPVPPKKRARHTAATSDEVTDVVPPRPARHLKPRDRSAEAIRRPKRQKTNANAHIDPLAPPQKPTRSSRSKSKERAEPIIGKVTIESGRTPEMSVTKLDGESYENMLISDIRMKFKSRPLPPTPGQSTEADPVTVVNTSSAVICPAGTPELSDPSVTETSLLTNTSDDSQGCNRAPQADLTNTLCVSTAYDVEVGSVVCAGSASADLDSSAEKSINVNSSTTVSSAVLDSVVQASIPYSSPSTLPAAELSVQDNIVNDERFRYTSDKSGHSACYDSNPTEANIIPNQSDCDIADGKDVNVLQASLRFRGQLDGESGSQDRVSVECTQKPYLVTAVVEPAQAERTEQTAHDNNSADNADVEKSATENKIQPEELTALSVTIDEVEALKECTTVQSENEPISVAAEIVKTDRKLSVATESTIELDECVTQPPSSNVDMCQVQSKSDGDRKLSVAAESVLLNFIAESTENLVLSSTVSDQTLTDESVSKNISDEPVSIAAESVIVNFVPESTESFPTASSTEEKINEIAPKSISDRRVSIAAESVAISIAETVNVRETTEILTDIEVSTHGADARKLSIAAEYVNFQSTLESTQALDTSITGQEKSTVSVESNGASAVATSSEQSYPEESSSKISVAAETVALSIPESVQIFETSVSNQERCCESEEPVKTSVASASDEDSLPKEIDRKISIAAETVALEFMPESTQTLKGENLEAANVIPTDETDALSVASVSVTTGNFADTVTNTSNGQITPGGHTTKTIPDAMIDALVQLSGNAPESSHTLSVDDSAEKSTTEQPNISSNLDETKAPESLSGSQTSITDDDSVVSVLTKDELTAREIEATKTSDASDEYKISEIHTEASTPTEIVDSDLKGGVTDINSRLEGISNFLDSVVRNFSPQKVENANDTFLESDSSPSVDPVSTSFTNISVSACSSLLLLDVPVAPDPQLTTNENDIKSTESQVYPVQSVDNTDPTPIHDTAKLEERTLSSYSEAPAPLSCSSSPPPIAASAADGAVAAASEGTVIPSCCDRKYLVTSIAEGIAISKDECAHGSTESAKHADSSLPKPCTHSRESIVSKPQASVFDLLDSGLGLKDQSAQGGGSVLMFINGEWHRL